MTNDPSPVRRRPATSLAIALIASYAAAWFGPAPAQAHPFHVTIAEATRNAETKRIEVALRLWPEDLEAALTKLQTELRDKAPGGISAPAQEREHPAAGDLPARINLDTTPDIDLLIAAYLDRIFLLAPPSERSPSEPPAWDAPAQPAPRATRILWLGKEIGARQAWLYFEVRLPAGMKNLEGAWISNRALFDVEPDQENIMMIRDGEFRITVRTEREAPWVRLNAPEPPKEPEHPTPEESSHPDD